MTDVILSISGMDCGACAVRIVRALKGLPGLREVSVSDTAGCARLTYDETAVDLGEIARSVARAGFDVPVGTAELRCPGADAGAEARLRAVFGVRSVARAGDTFTVTLWPVGTDAAALPAVLGLVFLVGLLTSTHCIGMCGGILLAQTTDAHGVTGRSKRGLIASAAYNAGRVVSYTAVGAVCGALGAVITYTPNIKSMVFTVAGALVLLIGLRMAGILPGLRPSETELPGACSLNARTRRRFAGQPLIIGLLTGVMPCGALSAMWLYAMSSGSAVRGALVMLVFSLGTVPLLFLFGALQSFLPRGWMKYIVKGSAVLVVTLGLSMLVKGIRLFGM